MQGAELITPALLGELWSVDDQPLKAVPEKGHVEERGLCGCDRDSVQAPLTVAVDADRAVVDTLDAFDPLANAGARRADG